MTKLEIRFDADFGRRRGAGMSTFRDPFQRMYRNSHDDREFWGSHAVLPVGVDLEHGKWTLVAVYRERGDDENAVYVDEARYPAAFYRVRAPGLWPAIVTGSGRDMRELARKLADGLSSGMLGFEKDFEKGPE